MSIEEITFDQFLSTVDPDYAGFTNGIHDFMLQNNCAFKTKEAKNGYVASFVHGKTKKVIANFVFRKTGMIIRIYGDHIHQYEDILQTLPANMIKDIKKAPVCKRLEDPAKCNSRCPMGNQFSIDGEDYKKCRYNSFMFAVREENYAAIKDFLGKELAVRA